MAKGKSKFKDEANLKAAAQEAEERMLKRKQSFRKADGTSESRGVSFDETEEPTEEEAEAAENAMVEAISEVAGSDEGILNSESKETLSSKSKSPGKQRTVKIVSDGTYENTSVYIGTSKLKHPDISIKISKESGVRIVFVKEESLF